MYRGNFGTTVATLSEIEGCSAGRPGMEFFVSFNTSPVESIDARQEALPYRFFLAPFILRRTSSYLGNFRVKSDCLYTWADRGTFTSGRRLKVPSDYVYFHRRDPITATELNIVRESFPQNSDLNRSVKMTAGEQAF